ncbi:hypothetical protein [Halomicrococcus sp. NG-SE-24]
MYVTTEMANDPPGTPYPNRGQIRTHDGRGTPVLASPANERRSES